MSQDGAACGIEEAGQHTPEEMELDSLEIEGSTKQNPVTTAIMETRSDHMLLPPLRDGGVS